MNNLYWRVLISLLSTSFIRVVIVVIVSVGMVSVAVDVLAVDVLVYAYNVYAYMLPSTSRDKVLDISHTSTIFLFLLFELLL